VLGDLLDGQWLHEERGRVQLRHEERPEGGITGGKVEGELLAMEVLQVRMKRG
jgi:hypothetical protein